MPPNLRSVIERVTRGGRSVVSRRNFSSCPNRGNDSKEAGGRVVDAAPLKSEARKMGEALPTYFVYGVGIFVALDIYKSRKKFKATQEE